MFLAKSKQSAQRSHFVANETLLTVGVYDEHMRHMPTRKKNLIK